MIISAVEHEAVRETVRDLARWDETGMAPTVVGVDAKGCVGVESVLGALRPETALVSLMLANNEVGSLQPVAEVARGLRDRSVLLHTDAVQAAAWVDVDVELSARPYPAPAPDTLLSGEGLFANGDQAFETELRRLGFHDLAKPELARRINERVGQVVSKLTYSSWNRGARYALNEGSGDCSEQMSLVVALCRQAEIPAIGLGGVATSRDRVVHATGYHDWAAYYAGNQWGVADPSSRRCGQDGSGYVAFEWIDGGPTSPDYIRRYRVTGGDVKVKME